MSPSAEGKTLAVERRRDLTPAEFRAGYFTPGTPGRPRGRRIGVAGDSQMVCRTLSSAAAAKR